MQRCTNFGRFSGKRGRPTQQELDELALLDAEMKQKKRRSIAFPTYEQLMEMRDVPIEEVDPEKVADLEDIDLSDSKDTGEWFKSLIAQTGNPFYMKIGGTLTHVFH